MINTQENDALPPVETIESRLVDALRYHFIGWHHKILNEFSEHNYQKELNDLKSDPVYSKFGFAIPEYILIRAMGRMSISIGRRLGEIYDKVPRFATAARFNLPPQAISPKFDGLELDINILNSLLSDEDKNHLNRVVAKRFNAINIEMYTGVGIEIRYNFNPNDSSRLRKDIHLGSLLSATNLLPIYLIFSSISPRQDAIARLTREGWHFLIGDNAVYFMSELINMDFAKILDRPKIREEIDKEVDSLMSEMLNSRVFRRGARLE